tara:strand:+ start:35 stop:298 length:264 start_codon:yes stop_codon:yes gene_type:complete
MALEKQLKDDYEVRTDYKHIHVRTKTSIMEDGKELSFSYHRKVLSPDMDISSESDEIKALAGAIWTDDVKKTWSDKLEADKKALEGE